MAGAQITLTQENVRELNANFGSAATFNHSSSSSAGYVLQYIQMANTLPVMMWFNEWDGASSSYDQIARMQLHEFGKRNAFISGMWMLIGLNCLIHHF